jgi:hypothetical protein
MKRVEMVDLRRLVEPLASCNSLAGSILVDFQG